MRHYSFNKIDSALRDYRQCAVCLKMHADVEIVDQRTNVALYVHGECLDKRLGIHEKVEYAHPEISKLK